MKVAFAHYSAANDISGVTTWAESFLLDMHRRGYDLYVLLIHIDGDINQSRLFEVLQKNNIKVEIYRKSNTFWEDLERTINFIKACKPQIFIPNCLKAFYVAASIVGKQGMPWILTMHSDDPFYWTMLEESSPAKNNGVVVCVSQHIMNRISSGGDQGNVWVIPYGVKVSEIITTFSRAPFRIVYSGRLIEAQKRISLVLGAMIELCKHEQNIECILLGDGDMAEWLKEEVKKNGLSHRIHFTGSLTPAMVKVELVNMHVIILMSDFEGLPVSLLEAMACGVVPVVRNINSGIPELVIHGETGVLVENDPAAFVKGVQFLFNNPDIWRQYSENAKKLINDQFSERISLDKWNVLLKQVNYTDKVLSLVRLPWFYKPYQGAFYKRIIYLKLRRWVLKKLKSI